MSSKTTRRSRNGTRRTLRFEGLDERLPLDADDSISEAIFLGVASATTPRVVSGSISPDVDVDMYRISVTTGQTVDFDIDTTLNGPGGLGSFLRVFNASGQEIAFNNDGMAPGENVIGFDAYLRFTFVTGGDYFVSVSNNTNTLFNPVTGNGDAAGGQNATGTYTLTATALPVDTDDQLNEAPSLGTINSTPDIINASINPDVDVDMYLFGANAGQSIDFDIDTTQNGPGGLDGFIRIFNASGQEIAFNDDGVGVGENVVGFDSFLRFTFATTGVYYIGVSNVNNTLYNATTGAGDAAGGTNSIGAYTLTIQTTATAPNDTDDALNEAPNLGSISTTPVIRNAAIASDVDVDMYRFSATTGQTIDFDIDTTLNGPGGLGSFIRLFNASGQEIAFNNDASAPGEGAVGFDAYLRFTFATGGVYYLGVSNANNTLYNASTGAGDVSGGPNATGDYTLTIQGLSTDSDDTLIEATNLDTITTTPDTVNSSISPDIDVDLYKFVASAGQVIDFDVDTTQNGAGGVDGFLRIFNSAGTEIAFNNNAVAPGENVVGFDPYVRFTFATAGTYYVGVSNANNTLYNTSTGENDAAGGPNAVGNYTLNVQTAATAPNDTDDTISEAIVLAPLSTTPVTTNATITPDVDVDMYRFAATAGQTIDFDIDTTLNGPGGLGSFIRLFNSSGTELAFNNNGAAPGENTIGFDAYLRFTFTASGNFYVAVSNANNTLFNAVSGNGDVSGGANATGAYTLSAQVLPVDNDDALNEARLIGAVSTTPATFTDSIDPDIDVDLYRFTVGNGDTVDFDIDTATNGPGGLGSFIRLFDGTGQEIAFNNDGAAPGETTLGFDSYLRFIFNTGGTYYLGVSNLNNTLYSPTTGGGDTGGGPNSIGAYQLTVQRISSAPTDTNDQMSEAALLGTPSTTPTTISASITPDTDVNMYRFTAVANQTIEFDIDTALNGPGGLGSYLRLFNSSGQQLAFNDNAAAPGEGGVGFDAFLQFTFTTVGTYYIGVSNAININYDPSSGGGDVAGGANSTGNYQLIVTSQPTAGVPALSLGTSVTLISEANGTTTATVTRTNASIVSPLVVNLSSSDTTEAIVPTTVTIPANQTSVTFTISGVDDSVIDGSQNVTITATAAGLTNGTLGILVTDNDANNIWHNSVRPLDVNNDTRITAFDAIAIINYLNQFGAGPVPTTGSPPPFYDVNADGLITSFDAIQVINYLNQNPVPSGPEAVNSGGEATTRAIETVAATQNGAADAYFAELGAQIDRERRVSRR